MFNIGIHAIHQLQVCLILNRKDSAKVNKYIENDSNLKISTIHLNHYLFISSHLNGVF